MQYRAPQSPDWRRSAHATKLVQWPPERRTQTGKRDRLAPLTWHGCSNYPPRPHLQTALPREAQSSTTSDETTTQCWSSEANGQLSCSRAEESRRPTALCNLRYRSNSGDRDTARRYSEQSRSEQSNAPTPRSHAQCAPALNQTNSGVHSERSTWIQHPAGRHARSHSCTTSGARPIYTSAPSTQRWTLGTSSPNGTRRNGSSRRTASYRCPPAHHEPPPPNHAKPPDQACLNHIAQDVDPIARRSIKPRTPNGSHRSPNDTGPPFPRRNLGMHPSFVPNGLRCTPQGTPQKRHPCRGGLSRARFRPPAPDHQEEAPRPWPTRPPPTPGPPCPAPAAPALRGGGLPSCGRRSPANSLTVPHATERGLRPRQQTRRNPGLSRTVGFANGPPTGPVRGCGAGPFAQLGGLMAASTPRSALWRPPRSACRQDTNRSCRSSGNAADGPARLAGILADQPHPPAGCSKEPGFAVAKHFSLFWCARGVAGPKGAAYAAGPALLGAGGGRLGRPKGAPAGQVDGLQRPKCRPLTGRGRPPRAAKSGCAAHTDVPWAMVRPAPADTPTGSPRAPQPPQTGPRPPSFWAPPKGRLAAGGGKTWARPRRAELAGASAQ